MDLRVRVWVISLCSRCWNYALRGLVQSLCSVSVLSVRVLVVCLCCRASQGLTCSGSRLSDEVVRLEGRGSWLCVTGFLFVQLVSACVTPREWVQQLREVLTCGRDELRSVVSSLSREWAVTSLSREWR